MEKMKLTTKRGQEFDVAEEVWAAWVKKHGPRARELALTWLVRRAEHAAKRDAGCPAMPPEWVAENMAAEKFALGLDRADDLPYDVGDLVDRLSTGRAMSDGQTRAVSEVCALVSDDEAMASLQKRWTETWEFETRPLGSLEKLLAE